MQALTNGTPNGLALQGERRLTMRLGDENVAVRVDADGFLKRVMRKVRLYYGTDLYCASRSPNATDKVQPFQPGYMKLVAAMGGQLLVPTAVNDPLTGQKKANPEVEFYPGTGIIRRVTATALCAVRNPVTGEWHASVATQLVDGEQALRQALLKLDQRDDAVRYMTAEDFEEEKRGELKGWAFLPAGAIGIAYNMRNVAVKGAYQTFTEQSATMRQRACSKAERLAADHNPVTRMTWDYGMLIFPDDGRPYIDVPVVSWVDHRGRTEMDAFITAMASNADGAEGVAEIVRTVSESLPDEVDDEEPAEVAFTPPAPLLTDRGPVADPLQGARPAQREVIDVRPEPVQAAPAAPVQAPPAAPAAKVEPEPAVEPAVEGAAPAARRNVPGDLAPVIAEIDRLEQAVRAINPDLVGAARSECKVTDPLTALSRRTLNQYVAALKTEAGE